MKDEIIHNPRSTGKSLLAVKIASAEQITIIVRDEKHKKFLMDIAKALKLNLPEPKVSKK